MPLKEESSVEGRVGIGAGVVLPCQSADVVMRGGMPAPDTAIMMGTIDRPVWRRKRWAWRCILLLWAEPGQETGFVIVRLRICGSERLLT